jgi:hypothetical protein
MNETPLDRKRERMVAALYDELSPEERREFESWLEDDPQLRADWEELQAARGFLGSAAAADAVPEMAFPVIPEVAEGAAYRPFDRARARSSGRGLWTLLRSPAIGFALGAATLAVLLLAGLRVDRVPQGLVLRFSSGDTQDPAGAAREPAPYITQDQFASFAQELIRTTESRLSNQAQQQNGEMVYFVRGLYDALAERQDRHRAEIDAEMRQAYLGMIGLGTLSQDRQAAGIRTPEGERLTPDHGPLVDPEED